MTNVLDYDLSDAHIHLGHCSITGYKIDDKKLSNFISSNYLNSGLVFPMDLELDYWNIELAKLLRNHKKFWGLHRVEFTDKFSTEETINAIDSYKKIIGVKFHPSFDRDTVMNKVWDKLFNYLNNNQKIVLIHCGRYLKMANYKYALKRASMNPDLTFILAHMGGNDLNMSKNAIRDAVNLPNVYFDTANVRTPLIIKEAVSNLGSERILFGSDYPWGSCYSNAYTILDSEISENAKIGILGRNLEKVIEMVI